MFRVAIIWALTSLFARTTVFAQSSPIYPANKTLTTVTINDNFYGTRNVSYFVTSNGLAIIDGDVVYGTVQDLLQHTIEDSTLGDIKAKRAFSAPNVWPSPNIKYKYDFDDTERRIGSTVSEAIRRWNVGAPYVTFTAVSPNGPLGIDGVVTISANDCEGCHASIGFTSAGHLFMGLQQDCNKTGLGCFADEATHEFGHILGLEHEHMRPDRDQYVHFECQNLDPNCDAGVVMPAGSNCCSPVPGCCGHLSDFDIIDAPGFDWTGPYDINSTMEYRADAFALPGTDTLISAGVGVVVPLSNIGFPSPLDFDRVCKMYAPWCPQAQACAAIDCPNHCQHIPVCDGSPICSGPRPKICCGGREWNEQCDAKRRACSSAGCDFLL